MSVGCSSPISPGEAQPMRICPNCYQSNAYCSNRQRSRTISIGLWCIWLELCYVSIFPMSSSLDCKNRTVDPLSFKCNYADVEDICFEFSFPGPLPGSNRAFYPLQVSYLQCKVTLILSITVCPAARA